MTEQADLDALAKTAAGSGGGGADTAAGGGGDGSRQPTDRAELVKWLQSDKGPGVQAFALAADAMLRSQGRTPAPNKNATPTTAASTADTGSEPAKRTRPAKTKMMIEETKNDMGSERS